MPSIPSRRAASWDKSIPRPWIYGPRSFITTLQVFPLRRFFTVTLVPNGKVLLAAVILFGSIVSPDAVFRPGIPVRTKKRRW